MEDSLTSGRIKIVCADEARVLLEREVAAFRGLYPDSEFELVGASSREAIRALFAAECDLAVVTRDLDVEERGAAVRGGLEVEGYGFARDAVVIIVHPSNTLENLALEDLRRVYDGRATRWSDLGGADRPVVPVVPPPASDITEYMSQEVLEGQPVRVQSIQAADDGRVAAEVAARPEAIGFTSLSGVREGVRTLRLASMTGMPYWKPDLEAVHRDQYPLTRSLNLYARPRGPKLANGFITFVTSREGQTLVREAGLVPTTVPVRFVRRSPMRGSHEPTGDTR